MYGKDLGDGSYRLADLLKDILLACPKLKRLRISSLEESEIDDKFLDLLRDFPQIVDHLHLPLQSGSPTVLQRMKRHYDTPSFLLTLSKVRAIRPDIAITTDVIVGFPLESDKEWQETMDFCKKAKFSEIHVFPYSPREGTYSYTLKDTSPEVKEKRVHELLDLSNELRQAYEERFYGKKMEVLFEDFDERNSLCYGHTANYLLVKVASKRKLHGEILDVIYDKESAAD
jgi:threonylcarbamoyladenosine tRNA methylthiotransferase MtaB